MKFGYWDVRGRGAAIRALLRYTGAEYEDVTYPLKGLHFKEEWLKVKHSLGMSFPNLPYLIDGELKLTQSLAILKYLGRKYGLAATKDPELAIEEMVLFQVNELSDRMRQVTHIRKYESVNDDEFVKDMEQLRKDCHTQFALLESYLQAGTTWFTGDSLSYVDFLAYEQLDWYRVLVQRDCLAKYEKLSQFMARFERLDRLKEYLASEQFRSKNLFGPSAKVGFVDKN